MINKSYSDKIKEMSSLEEKENEKKILGLESIALSNPLFVYGYGFNKKQPCIFTKLTSPDFDSKKLKNLCARFITKYKNQEHAITENKINNLADLLIALSSLILKKYNHPLLNKPSVIETKNELLNVYTIIFPCLNHESYWLVLKSSINIIRSVLDGHTNQKSIDLLIENNEKSISKPLLKFGLKGFNREHFLIAANDLNIPWLQINSDLFQFGYGSASRLLESSFTDQTSNIGTKLARNKIKAAQILRKAGLPVAQHFIASSEVDAIKIAEKLGYPVVVKPANLDGGTGVMAFLQSEEEVKKAFDCCKKYSKLILIEKHIFGNDYRVQIVNNEIHGVIERSPGGVKADGIHTIRKLLDIQNTTRKEAKDDRRFLHEIKEDDEAAQLLKNQSLHWDSIPNNGTFIRLRGASNVSSGGIPKPIDIDDVHPDNASLALRAARILRLDVAGVDLLIPDIKISWLKTHASVCEVNAQPQMFTSMHRPMLQSLFGKGTNKGRIPIIIIISSSFSSNIYNPIYEELKKKFKNVGLTRKNGVWINDQCIIKKEINSFSAARALIFDSSVDSMLLCVEDYEALIQGWPVDQCDILIIPDNQHLKEDHLELSSKLIKFSQYLFPKKIIISNKIKDAINFFQENKKSSITIVNQSPSLESNESNELSQAALEEINFLFSVSKE